LITHSQVPFSLNDGTHRFNRNPAKAMPNDIFPQINPNYDGVVQTISVGNNRILYLPDNTPTAWSAVAALLPGVLPEETAPPTVTIQAYPLLGGQSYVVWDLATLQNQQAKNDYRQTPIPPVALGFKSPNSRDAAQLYDFYADGLTTVPAGQPIRTTLLVSSGIYYVGDARSPSWQTTLGRLRAVRSQFQSLLQY
jgi:hypothetical protein